MSSTNVCSGLLTGSLLLAYVVGVVVLQGLVRALTGQESNLAIIVSTLVIAALLNPVRRRVQAAIDAGARRRRLSRLASRAAGPPARH